MTGLELTAIVTATPRAKHARAPPPRSDGLRVHRQLWDEIDLLVVAAPNRVHVPLAIVAVEHGLPSPSTSRWEVAFGCVSVQDFQRLMADRSSVPIPGLRCIVALAARSLLATALARLRPDSAAWARGAV